MTNFIIKKIQDYIVKKTMDQINRDPIDVARQHFDPAIKMLGQFKGIKSMFWVGSYEYDLQIIEYFRNSKKVNAQTFENSSFKKHTDSEKIIEILLGETRDNYWFLGFFSDSLELSTNLNLLDSFKIHWEENSKLNADFLRLI